MAPTKKIDYKLVGRSVMAVIDKKKLVITTPDTKLRDKLKTKLEAYNLRPSDARKAELIKLFTPKAEKAKVEKIVKKKKAHQAVKVTKRELVESKKEIKVLRDYFKDEKRLYIDGGDVKMVGYDIPMPKELIDAISLAIDKKEGIDHLLNFWMLTLLNPNPIARQKLFAYIGRHKLIVTPNGYFVTYRMVKRTDDPNVFTHAHSVSDTKESPRMYYKMGQVAKLDRKTQCDEDGSRDCSKGLHTGTPDFIGIKLGDGYSKGVYTKSQGGGYGTGYDAPSQQSFDNTFGNQAVIVLVNPMHVVSVPDSDTRKLRACELYFCKTTTAEEVLKIQQGEYSTYDNKYKEFELKELVTMLKGVKLEKFVEGVLDKGNTKKIQEQVAALRSKLTFSNDAINSELTLEEINRLIQSRVIKATKSKK